MEESIKHPEDFTGLLYDSLHLHQVSPNEFSPLTLAYIGDAVYELIIRTKVINQGSIQVNKMHKKSASLVKAKAQADLIKVLEPQLTEEEHRIYKRGRNAKSGSMAKNATMQDYRMATGFEALAGYLYLSNQHARLFELVKNGLLLLGELETGEEE